MTQTKAKKQRTSRKPNPLGTPWHLIFDRDGTEDYGVIIDTEGNDLVASHLPFTTMPRWKDRDFGDGCFWLPYSDSDEPTPVLVRQMQVMATAPKLLAMLKMAVAASDPAKDTWVKEAREVIAEATVKKRRAVKAVHLDERDLPF